MLMIVEVEGGGGKPTPPQPPQASLYMYKMQIANDVVACGFAGSLCR